MKPKFLTAFSLSLFVSTAAHAWPPANFVMPSEAVIKNSLTAAEYDVVRRNGTESPYSSALLHEKRNGIYIDIVSGEPLFSSLAKYDSQTGWPSFYQPITSHTVVLRPDYSGGTVRTEVRSQYANSHLGHVFNDGPAPTGLRYCINGIALIFIPLESLEAQGYGEWLSLFGVKKKTPSAKKGAANIVKSFVLNEAAQDVAYNLRTLAGLDSSFDGYKIISVSGKTTPNSPAVTIAKILLNYVSVGSQKNPGTKISIRPTKSVVLASDSILELEIAGSTFIHEIQIELAK